MSECKNTHPEKNKRRFRDRPVLTRAAITLAWIAGTVVFLAGIALTAVTIWLTPERLTEIINTEASKRIDADITAHNVRYTLWSSFPRLCIDIDSIKIVSRTLYGIPSELRSDIPRNADFLASTGKLHGGINILRLLKKDISVSDILIDSLRLNLVTVSDSLSNFDIFRRFDNSGEIPYFSADSAKLTSPAKITIYNHPSKSRIVTQLSQSSAVRRKTPADSYTLSVKGDVMVSDNLKELLDKTPFDLTGQLDLAFHPLRVSLKNYDISVAGYQGSVNLDMLAEKRLRLDRFSAAFKGIDPADILSHVRIIPESGTEAVLRLIPSIDLAVSLKHPYSFDSPGLPDIKANVEIPEGDINIPDRNNRTLTLRHSEIRAEISTGDNMRRPAYARIMPFDIYGEDLDLSLQAFATDILTDPDIRIAVKGYAESKRLSMTFQQLRPYGMTGKIESDAIISFRLSDKGRDILKNLKINGDINLNNFGLQARAYGLEAYASDLDLNFGGEMPEITAQTIQNGIFDFNANADMFHLHSNGYDLDISSAEMSGKLKESGKNSFTDISSAAPFEIKAKAASAALSGKRDTVKMTMGGLVLKGSIKAKPGKGMAESFGAMVKSADINANIGSAKITAKDCSASISASLMNKRMTTPRYTKAAAWTADSRSLKMAGHTDEFLSVRLPEKAVDFIRQWKSHIGLKIGSGTILTPALPLHNGFADLDLEASFDSVKLNSLKFNSQDTRLSAKGELSNLRQFLTSGTMAPVKGDITVNIDTVRINQLCGAYNHGLRLTHGPKASVLTVIPDTLTPSDTVALLLPRNIIADIKISAMMTEYTNLYLHNLTTGISLRNGILDISDLGVDSDFGTLNMDFRYDTSDIQRLAMNLDMNLSDVRLVEFFRNFHTLLLMMPQMKNLRGDLSANAKARLFLFPDMYLNMPSLWADIYVRGDNMVLHQDSFIRHLTRMMLIHGTEDIALSDLNIHASIHDNLMEVYPFDIDFDRYRLSFGGLNNFDGDMYYHLGIENSPIPFPFGINIKGNLSHPEIRFGGDSFNIDKGEEITSSIMEEKRLNLMLVLKRLAREMIEKAAEADSTPASKYVFR